MWASEELEKAIIGIMITNQDKAADILKSMKEDDFYYPNTKAMFLNAKDRYANKQPIDIMYMILDGFDATFVAECTDNSMKVSGEKYIINQLATMTAKRHVFKACATIKGKLDIQEFESPQEVKSHALASFDLEVPEYGTETDIVSVLDRYQNRIIEERAGRSKKISWGIKIMDKMTGGLWGAEFTIIAAGPATGKTAFALQIALSVAEKHHVTFATLEMSETQVTSRLVSNVGKMNGDLLKTPEKMTDEDFDKFSNACTEIGKKKIHIDSVSTTIQDIHDVCRRKVEKGKMDLLIVDYLQLLSSAKKAESRLQEVNYISRTLKLISRDLNIPVIALSQMNREGQRSNQEPKLYDLRESGALEQDADNVIFLWDPKPNVIVTDDKKDIELIIAKQRSGSTGKIHFTFHMNVMKFYWKEW